MRKKDLELVLERLGNWRFPSPKKVYEQYTTPSSIAADLAWTAYTRGDIEGRTVADLGAGTGILAYAAAMLGASTVLAVEIDPDALETLSTRARGDPRIHVVQADVGSLALSSRVDTVLQNPPFGVVRRHADRIFFERALELAHTVYTLHKANPDTRRLLLGIAEKRGFRCVVAKTYNFPIPQVYREHFRRIYYVSVDAYICRRLEG